MKKLIIGALLALVATVFNSCDYMPPSKDGVKEFVQNYVDSVISGQECLLNPMFSTPEDVAIYRETVTEQLKLDSLFFRLSDKDVENVASVVIKSNGYATKKAIVDEYNKNSDVYSKLPDSSAIPPTKKDTTNMEGSGATKVIISSTTSSSTDTIDGVPRLVITKTEKSYEK